MWISARKRANREDFRSEEQGFAVAGGAGFSDMGSRGAEGRRSWLGEAVKEERVMDSILLWQEFVSWESPMISLNGKRYLEVEQLSRENFRMK